MLVDGMYGLGDNIYQRSVLREIKERVYLRTSFPQLYVDLSNVRPVAPNTHLRTQKKNIERQVANTWHVAPGLPYKKLSYAPANLRTYSILQALAVQLNVVPKIFDLPKFSDNVIDKPYVIVRPSTLRAEWFNHARNPKAGYICKTSTLLRKMGYYVVTVADLDGNKEWCENIPEADLAFNHGELCFEQLMSLIQNATLVVGGVGWIVPACVAAKTPIITILGGQGGHNAPAKIIDKPMDTEKIRFIEPDKYCMCIDNRHACKKDITDFEQKVITAIKELT